MSKSEIEIRKLVQTDIPDLVESFKIANWEKPASTFEIYLSDQAKGIRSAWVAFLDGKLAGYITLAWKSKYKSFRQHGIPEIMDLNVLPSFRKHGVGTKVLKTAETEAFSKSNIVGLGVVTCPGLKSPGQVN